MPTPQKPSYKQLESLLRRMQEKDEFCACGNYYSSKRCQAGPRCDLGHKEKSK